MRTRSEQIEFLENLGLDASRFKAMTDQEWESERDFLEEQSLRQKAEYPHPEPLPKPVRKRIY